MLQCTFRIDLVIDEFDQLFAVVRVDDDGAAVWINDEDVFKLLFATEDFVFEDESAALRMLADLLKDENFRGEFGTFQPIAGDDWTPVLATSLSIELTEPDLPTFDSDFYVWWQSFWGVAYDHSMVMIEEPIDDLNSEVHLKVYDEETDHVTHIDTVQLEKHYLFSDLGYTSDVLDVHFIGEPEIASPIEVEIVYPGTVQVEVDYWAVTLHRSDGEVAPLVMSAMTYIFDEQGPSPYDGGEVRTHLFPMLEFETEDQFFEFVDAESAEDGTISGGGECQEFDYDHLIVCALELCDDFSKCMNDARRDLEKELNECGFSFLPGLAVGGGGLVAGVTAGVAVAKKGAKVGVVGGIKGVVIGGGIGFVAGFIGGLAYSAVDYYECDREAWRTYRLARCHCLINSDCVPAVFQPPNCLPPNIP